MNLEVFSDMSERVNYNLLGFPLYVREGELCNFVRYAACHWHPDLEFFSCWTAQWIILNIGVLKNEFYY